MISCDRSNKNGKTSAAQVFQSLGTRQAPAFPSCLCQAPQDGEKQNTCLVTWKITDITHVYVTKASYASWSSSCFNKEYARGWKRGFIDTIRLIPPPRPLAACNPEVVGSTPPPSIESKTVVFTVFFALQGCETQVKCTILRFCSYHSIWVALIGFKYSMKKKVSSRARPP